MGAIYPATMHRGHPLQPRDWSSSDHQDRFDRVRPYLEGRTVLDVGAASGVDRSDWMHSLVAGATSDLVGIDVDEQRVARACARGFDVRVADAEGFDLGRTFDVVWAGELIEHLSCPASFLDSARRHLDRGGSLVITTPNAFAVANFVYRVGGRPRVNRGHVCWYDETTLDQLLARHGFRVVEVGYVPHRTPGRVRAVVARVIRSLLPRHLAENTLLVVATPA